MTTGGDGSARPSQPGALTGKTGAPGDTGDAGSEGNVARTGEMVTAGSVGGPGGAGQNGQGAGRRRGRLAPPNQEWLFALLPAFPLVLLVARLWYAGHQDTQTMLLLVQYISPLGLLSSILVTAVWVIPAMVLMLRLLGTLYLVSTRVSARLVRISDRLPDWVVAVATVVAFVTWQLRFLPALLMIVLAIGGLTVRDRYPDRTVAIHISSLVLPAVVAVIEYVALAPAIADAVHEGERVTLALLALPPALALFLTGPIPRGAAWIVTNGVAVMAAVLVPLVVSVVFLQVPILPLAAIQTSDPKVVIGFTVTVDDLMTTVLDSDGGITFIRNDTVVSKTLCPGPGDVPHSRVDLHGWYVETNLISWLAPGPASTPDDPRCQGRPCVIAGKDKTSDTNSADHGDTVAGCVTGGTADNARPPATTVPSPATPSATTRSPGSR